VCFASSLLEELERQKQNFQTMLEVYTQANAKINKLKKENYNQRCEIERLKDADPLGRSINTASAHASRQRIRDLEGQLRANGIEPQ
jgi:cell division FtsZ-interacting protein ZapD